MYALAAYTTTHTNTRGQQTDTQRERETHPERH